MSKSRVPLQVSPKFMQKLKEIQKKIMMKGQQISLRDLTEDIANLPVLNEIENKLIKKDINIGIKFDRRII